MIVLNDKKYFSVDELRKSLELSKQTLYKHLRRKNIEIMRLGYKIFVDEKNVLKMFEIKEGVKNVG